MDEITSDLPKEDSSKKESLDIKKYLILAVIYILDTILLGLLALAPTVMFSVSALIPYFLWTTPALVVVAVVAYRDFKKKEKQYTHLEGLSIVFCLYAVVSVVFSLVIPEIREPFLCGLGTVFLALCIAIGVTSDSDIYV